MFWVPEGELSRKSIHLLLLWTPCWQSTCKYISQLFVRVYAYIRMSHHMHVVLYGFLMLYLCYPLYIHICTNIHGNILYAHTYLPTCLPTYLPSYLPSTYLPTDLPTYLPTYTHTGHDIRWDPLDILSIDPFFVSLEVPQRLQSCKLRPSFNAAPIGSLGPRVTTRVSQRAEELFPWPFGVQRRKNIGRYCIYGWDKTAIPKWKLYG